MIGGGANELSGQYSNITKQWSAALQKFPEGKDVALSLQDIVDAPDFFGGEENYDAWAGSLLDNHWKNDRNIK
ncbi:MAG: hypothetical protein Pars2KO_31290 [Parasphingorhabdus sp.]